MSSLPTIPMKKNALMRFSEWLTVSRFVIIACALLCLWLVFVPLASLLYVAFAEDTPEGPGAFTFDNFINAYTVDHLWNLVENSVIFAIG